MSKVTRGGKRGAASAATTAGAAKAGPKIGKKSAGSSKITTKKSSKNDDEVIILDDDAARAVIGAPRPSSRSTNAPAAARAAPGRKRNDPILLSDLLSGILCGTVSEDAAQIELKRLFTLRQAQPVFLNLENIPNEQAEFVIQDEEPMNQNRSRNRSKGIPAHLRAAASPPLRPPPHRGDDEDDDDDDNIDQSLILVSEGNNIGNNSSSPQAKDSQGNEAAAGGDYVIDENEIEIFTEPELTTTRSSQSFPTLIATPSPLSPSPPAPLPAKSHAKAKGRLVAEVITIDASPQKSSPLRKEDSRKSTPRSTASLNTTVLEVPDDDDHVQEEEEDDDFVSTKKTSPKSTKSINPTERRRNLRSCRPRTISTTAAGKKSATLRANQTSVSPAESATKRRKTTPATTNASPIRIADDPDFM